MSHTAGGRWPLGTSSNSENSSHSHIQVVPRADDGADRDPGSNRDTSTPSFRSHSLLCPMPNKDTTSSTDDHGSESAVQGKTFADMARRICQKDNEVDDEQPPYAPNSVAGIIKLQTHRKKAGDQWLQKKPRNTEEPRSSDDNGLDAFRTPNKARPSTLIHKSASSHREADHEQANLVSNISPSFHYSSAHTNRVNTADGPLHLLENDREIRRMRHHTDLGDQHTKLFGKLPDPIRLHEQLGEFDGQVIFIAHPNRDVSAHQWSSASFQWEYIGHYAQCRSRVEGPLASDLVNGCDPSYDALMFFKLASNNREKDIVECGRPNEEITNIAEPVETEIIRRTLPNSISRLPVEDTIEAALPCERFGEKNMEAFKLKTDELVRDHIDDPFLATIGSHEIHRVRGLTMHDVANFKGSLDLKYKFPVSSSASTLRMAREVTIATPVDRSLHEAPDAPYMLNYRSRPFEETFQRDLREVSFGEEASNGSTFSDVSGTSARGLIDFSSLNVTESQSKWRVSHFLDGPTPERAIGTKVGTQQPTARSLFPPTGLTIANPHRHIPHPYLATMVKADARNCGLASNTSRPETTVMSATNLGPLRSSDPDVMRQYACPEIANGLSHQSPTIQSFAGPFFAASKPTAHDPTASFAVQIGEEEKLHHWFRDGHRPARQREYAKSLAPAAATAGKCRDLSAVGDATDSAHYKDTDITIPLVRLYETFSEYIEELRKGSGGSYFSRSWKPAPAYLLDTSPDGNNSFFSDGLMSASQLHQRAKPVADYREGYMGNMGGLSVRSDAMQFHRSIEMVQGPRDRYGEKFARKAGTHHIH